MVSRTMADAIETDPLVLRAAIERKVRSRMACSAELVVPALPAMVDLYAKTLADVFSALGRPLAADERTHLEQTLALKAAAAFAASPTSKLRIEWRTDPAPAVSLGWSIVSIVKTMAEEYRDWERTKPPPLFGKYPDAKVMEVARSLGAPQGVSCLDVGAGTGRNALALAEAGFAVTAVEVVPELLAALARDGEAKGVTVSTVRGDALSVNLPPSAYHFAFVCEVVPHFRHAHELATMLRNLAPAIVPGGRLLFSSFVAQGDYVPDQAARNVSELTWATLFTRDEIADAVRGTPFLLISDESVHDYEAARVPSDGFPPTSWYADWSQGRDVFRVEGKPPMDLRWLLFERTTGGDADVSGA